MTGPGGDAVVVLITAPDSETAERLASALVEERLAACANLVRGVTSIYRWQGAIHRDEETLLVLKTTRSASEALRARAVELHPYDVPEVLALEVGSGHRPYLEWIGAEVKSEI